ncbi:hypothetical protein [Dongshaea marina]|uniref:hypothetical protein n=1 Tax=Dongshaea marina TaxID=2047966 RepID=UPI000D3E1936|nr:hypothetical protein [Dongshaea marina]
MQNIATSLGGVRPSVPGSIAPSSQDIFKLDPQLSYLQLGSEDIMQCKPYFMEVLANSEALKSGVTIDYNPQSSGSYKPSTGHIEMGPISDPKDPMQLSGQVAALAHELSHAKDAHEGRVTARQMAQLHSPDLQGDTRAMYKTELKAWMVEALQSKVSMDAGIQPTTRMKDLVKDLSTTVNKRIELYRSQASLPQSWGAEKILQKTKLEQPLKDAIEYVEKTSISSPEEAEAALKELDRIFA